MARVFAAAEEKLLSCHTHHCRLPPTASQLMRGVRAHKRRCGVLFVCPERKSAPMACAAAIRLGNANTVHQCNGSVRQQW